MTHLVRLQIQLGGSVFEHLENCIFYIGKKKSQLLGSEIMCHCTLRWKKLFTFLILFMGKILATYFFPLWSHTMYTCYSLSNKLCPSKKFEIWMSQLWFWIQTNFGSDSTHDVLPSWPGYQTYNSKEIISRPSQI